jgi:hypothetical protein
MLARVELADRDDGRLTYALADRGLAAGFRVCVVSGRDDR